MESSRSVVGPANKEGTTTEHNDNTGIEQGVEDLSFESFDEISEALEAEMALVLEMPDDMAQKPEFLKEIGIKFWLLFDDTRNESNINNAIFAFEVAETLLPNSDTRRATLLHQYGLASYERYTLSGSMIDLDQAISTLREAASLMNDSHVQSVAVLDLLGSFIEVRFDSAGDLDDIAEAISLNREIVGRTSQEHSETPERLNSLGICLRKRFLGSGDPSDISEAISLQRNCLQLTPQEHEDTPRFLESLAISLQTRFEHTGNHEDLSDATSLRRRCVEIANEGHPNLPIWLNTLGMSLFMLFESTGNPDDISEAIGIQRRSIQATPEGHNDLPGRLNNLGNYLQRRFEHTGNLDDISEAILLRKRSIQLTLDMDENLPRWTNNLGISLQTRFEHTGELTDVFEAISLQRKSVELTPEGHADLPQWLNNLGISLTSLFEHTGDLADISEAISVQRKSVQLADEGYLHLPRWLSNLGVSLEARFERTGDLIDISESISLQRSVIRLTREDHAELPERLNSLGNSLDAVFRRTENLDDISEAISLRRRCIELTPKGHVELPRRLNSLGSSLYRRFERTKDEDDIKEAISLQRESLQLTDDKHTDLAIQLNNLGMSLQGLFDCTQDLDGISEAISLQMRCIERTPEGHASLPRWFYNLGNSFQMRFELTDNLSDLSEAIRLQQESIQLIPEGHADLPSLLTNLGKSLYTRFERTEEAADAQSAMINFELAAASITGPPSARFWAAEHWVQCCKKMNSSSTKLMEAYRTAIHLISQVAGLEQTIETRYTKLINVSHLSSSAAATAISLGLHSTALEWLEQGRCLVWSQLNNLRTPVDELREHNSILADEIVRVSTALERAGSRAKLSGFAEDTSMSAKISMQAEAHAHIQLAQEWDQLITKVREIPHFKDFLSPASYSSLIQGIPKSGHVVVVNIHEDRSDALVLNHDVQNPLHFSLPNLSYETAASLRNSLKTLLLQSNIRSREDDYNENSRGSRRHNPEGGITNLLRKLWLFLVKPILVGLKYDKPSTLPSRIWWCATGPLAFLPIHAAGIYTTADTSSDKRQTISDFVVSSYVPTVKTLIDKMKMSREDRKARFGILSISQPDTPKLGPLPATTKELEAIRRILTNYEVEHLCLESTQATLNRVKEEMEVFRCIHLACHASQNTKNPLQSCFYLYDGHLELMEIIRKHMKGAELAFLSACQTSTGDEKLSEEAVHLAGGMLAAGYRGVVGTMWSIKDSYGPQLAEAFYSNLLARESSESATGKVGLSSKGAAHALHYATQEMRKKLDNSERALLTWIPFVHLGV